MMTPLLQRSDPTEGSALALVPGELASPDAASELPLVECEVGPATRSNFFVGFEDDLSDGGVFVASFELLPIGTLVALRVRLPDGERLESVAVVRWTRAHNPATPELWPGMGLEFVPLTQPVRAAIEAFALEREPLFHPGLPAGAVRDPDAEAPAPTRVRPRLRDRWRESNLRRRPAWFARAYALVRAVALAAGLAGTLLAVMALLGPLVADLRVRAGIAAAVALLVPALLARALRPKNDPIVALGFTSEVYALVWLGFAVAFTVGAARWTRPLLAQEGDRAARAGAAPVAQVAWFVAGAGTTAPRGRR